VSDGVDFMGDRRVETAFRDLDALFRLGLVSGMSDGQLLEQFTAQTGADSELAFEAIVQRHGPMVLGVCRRVLGDDHAAEDAFQATFMVLALRPRAIRMPESSGPWLHGVAMRIARRALVLRRRRREEPVVSPGLVAPKAQDPALVDLQRVIDEELSRLPDKYRRPVVLCYLEGQTQDEAARTLGWTKGTVSGRLARAKDLLRHRLTRRGLAPSAGLLAAALTSETASAAVPGAMVLPTVRAAAAAVLGGLETGQGTGRVASLAREAMKVMLLGRLGRAVAQIGFLALGAAALATPIFLPATPAPLGNLAGGRAVAPPRVNESATLLARADDPLPPRARMRLGTTQRRHTRGVAGIDFTRDGKAAVTAQSDGLVRFWDPERGRLVKSIDVLGGDPSQDKLLRDLAISPDGELMAAAGFVFDPVRRRIVHRVWIWDLTQNQPRREIDVPTVDLFCLAFAPDGATLATGGFAGAVQLWDVATGACRMTLSLGKSSIYSLSFAPDGKILAVCEQGKGARLWDLEQRRETFLADPMCGMIAPIFSPDRRLMAVNSLGGEVVLWDRATGQKHVTAAGAAIAFAPDSHTMAMWGPDGGTLEVIDTESGSELWKNALGWGPTRGDVAFSPEGKTIITERGGALRFFEARSGRERLRLPEAHEGEVSVVRYTPEGRSILTAGDDGTVRQWDAVTARQLRVFAHDGRVHQLAVSADGASLATAVHGPGACVSVWDLATGVLRRRWPEIGDIGGSLVLAFSADGATLLAFDQQQGLSALEIATGERDGDIEQPQFSLGQDGILDFPIRAGMFSPGDQFLAVSTAATAYVAEVATGTERLFTPSLAMTFTSDGRSLAVATPAKLAMNQLADGSYRTLGQVVDGVELIDLGTLKKKRFDVFRDSVTALALSPNGNVVAVAGGWMNPVVRLYRSADGRAMETFTCPARVNKPGGLAFSPDGRSLAAGFDDTTVVIWEIRDVR
jgi:RNA polymerase sigma factor (sigma-70 family)